MNNLQQPGDFMFLCKMPSCRFLRIYKYILLFTLREETKAGKGTSVYSCFNVSDN